MRWRQGGLFNKFRTIQKLALQITREPRLGVGPSLANPIDGQSHIAHSGEYSSVEVSHFEEIRPSTSLVVVSQIRQWISPGNARQSTQSGRF
jgi:hypothetical protein